MDTPTQIISQPALFREIFTQYLEGNVDEINFWYWEIHNPNGSTVSYIEVPGKLEFDLRSLKPLGSTSEQDKLPPDLIARIKNDTAYKNFSRNNFSTGTGGCLHDNCIKSMERENDW